MTKSMKDVYRSVTPAPTVERDEGEPKIISGYASVFNTPYEINSFAEGHFIERVSPGAFEETFARDRESIRLLLDHGHDPSVGMKPLGKITELREDGTGAFYRGELFDAQYVRELIPALEASQYGASFRFRVEDEEWDDSHTRSEENPEGLPIRTITKLRVMELGPTTFGASPAATASVRSATDHYHTDLARSNESQNNEDDKNQKVEVEPQGAHAVAVGYESNVSENANEKEDPMPKEVEDSNERAEDVVEENEERAAQTFDSKGNPDPNGKYDKNGNLLEDDESEEDEGARATADASDAEEEDEEAQPVQNKAKRSVELPKSYEERAARIAEIDARHSELDTAAGDESLTRSAQTEYDDLEAERSALVKANKAIEERRALVAERANAGAVETVRGAANVTRKPENMYDVDEVRKNSYSHEGFVRGLRDNAKRIIEERDFESSDVETSRNQEAVSKLLARKDNRNGDLSKLVMTTGSEAYRSGFAKWVTSKGTAYLEADEARAMSLGTDAAGGYRVPFDLDPSIILTSDGVVNPMRQLSRVEQIVGKNWQGVTTAGVTLDMEGEAAEVDDDSFTLAQPEANAHRASAYVPYSIELDESDAGLISGITTVIQDAKDRLESTQFILGTGDGMTGVQGIVTGMPTASQIVTATTDAGFGPEDIFALDDDLAPRHRANASFIANKATYNSIRQMGTTDGYALWERLGGGNPSQLIGYNAHEASTVPNATEATTSDGNPFLILGDFKKYLIVDRIGMIMDVVPQVFGANQRPTGQRGLVTYWWFGGLILDGNAFRGLVLDETANA